MIIQKTNKGLDIVFFGTPDFAAVVLQALLNSPHNIAAVISQPDKPQGRKGIVIPTPVSALARSNLLLVHSPENVKDPQTISLLQGINADIFVVAAYGQFLNNKLLNMPRFGAVNVHASLLPKYRGASPIASAIINGETMTGVSIMQMERGMDTGAVILSREMAIDTQDTAETLHDKLATLGGETLLSALDLISAGQAVPTPQNNAEATYAPLLAKEMGLIDFSKPAFEIYNQVRGLTPWPGAYMKTSGGMLKVWNAYISGEVYNLPPGTVINNPATSVKIACGDGQAIGFCEVQAPGGKRMSDANYRLGHPNL